MLVFELESSITVPDTQDSRLQVLFQIQAEIGQQCFNLNETGTQEGKSKQNWVRKGMRIAGKLSQGNKIIWKMSVGGTQLISMGSDD